MSAFKNSIYGKYNGRCAYCGNQITIDNMTVDHIFPKSSGGVSSLKNCNPSCSRCNSIKANGSIEDMREKIKASVQKIKTDRDFQMIKKYKLATLLEEDVIFYFEEKKAI